MKQRRRHTNQFSAPWGRSVKVITGAVVVLVLAMAILPPFLHPSKGLWALIAAPTVAAAVLGIVGLFCVRGYTVKHRELLIQRLFWQTSLPLKGLEKAYADAQAMTGSFKTIGNGGLFAYTGWFRSKHLGKFRALVTDATRCVVLKFRDRTVVVSPDDPVAFVRALGFEEKAGGRDD